MIRDSRSAIMRGNPLRSLLIGTIVSGIAFWLIWRETDLAASMALLLARLDGNPGAWALAALAFGIQTLATLFVLRRWQVMLHPHPTSFWRLAQVFYLAHLLNTTLPLKLGTAARVALAAESEHLNLGFVLSSLIAEKALDTLAMLLLVVALTPFLPLPEWLREPLVVSVWLTLFACCCWGTALLCPCALVRRARASILDLTTRHRALCATACRFVHGMVENITTLTRRREALRILFWTLWVWLAGGAVNQLLLSALGIHADWNAAWLLLVALQIGTRLPSLPANLGVFHYTTLVTLALYGVDETAALGYAVLLHLIVFILPACLGAALAWPIGVRLGR